MCHSASGLCDVDDYCDGVSASCPATYASADTWCGTCKVCNGANHCGYVLADNDPNGDCASYRGCDGGGVCRQWTQQLGSSANDKAWAVATDSQGNLYVAGSTFGDLDGNTNAGDYDMFLVKYDSTGAKQWVRQLGTSSNDEGHGVATDSQGNVYVAGETNGDLDAGTSAGGVDVFVVKYDGAGTRRQISSISALVTATQPWVQLASRCRLPSHPKPFLSP
jgi:hypothetical protein